MYLPAFNRLPYYNHDGKYVHTAARPKAHSATHGCTVSFTVGSWDSMKKNEVDIGPAGSGQWVRARAGSRCVRVSGTYT